MEGERMSKGSCTAEVVLPLSSSDYSYSLSKHVSYSCDSCGYDLNLNSCNRNISIIDEKYGKSMKRGVISFFSIDESRFTLINRVKWLPYSWRLFRRRTRLLCRNCGSYIGTAWNPEHHWDGISTRTSYEIKIRSLRPVSFEGSALFDLGSSHII